MMVLPGPLPREVAGYLLVATRFSAHAKCGFLHLWASPPSERFCASFPGGGPAAGVAERGATSRRELRGTSSVSQGPAALLPWLWPCLGTACPRF